MSDIHSISNRQKTDKKSLIAFASDYQNVRLTIDSANLLLEFAKSKGRLIYKNVYYNSQCENQSAAKDNLASFNFTWINVPCPLKNSADNQLMVDCLEYIHRDMSPDVFILVSGDGDFAKLVSNLQKLGKYVIVFARFGNVKKELKELADEFHFIDELGQLVKQQTQHQNTSIQSFIAYNEAIKYLTEAIKSALNKKKPTTFPYVDNLMRQLCPQYQGVSSICKPDGQKFKNFSQFVDAAVKDGKVQKHDEELFLIELDKFAA
ncbi:NYN domain-containing protein [Nostoc sp. TCL26-01]|uniref:NYN domain-containing protein n=1 Tax=Nostoc sp. TCL26-01 TaxID=2576904 RepID=UPI0015BE358B|nr:NYN domain-containing protein [Nostoc sp. TCL26-01]QLE58039.1 NYN domain-containing protein [Nostoc sp. TCL26-01]